MPYRMMGGVAAKSVSLGDFDAWLDVQTNRATAGSNGYNAVAWVYRCLNLRANAVMEMPRAFVRADGNELDEEPYKLDRLLWQTEAALCSAGASYVHMRGNKRRITDLQWLNPYTMKVVRDKNANSRTAMALDSKFFIEEFVQRVDGKEVSFSPDEIIYTRLWNDADDVQPGVSPLDVLRVEANLSIHLNAWANKFFEQGAIPSFILWTEGRVPDPELERIQTLWQRMTSGIRHAWKAVVMQMGLKPQVLTPPVEQLVIPELSLLVRQQIATAFGVPQTLLEDAANYATAVEHEQAFITKTVAPECSLIAEALNEQLFEGLGLELEFRPQEMDILQVDESQRAGSLEALRRSGIPLKLALEILGYDLTDEQWAAVDAIEDANEQLREQLMQAPAQPQRQEPEREPVQGDEMKADLQRWQRKALTRLREGRGAGVEFTSQVIPADVAAEIGQALAVCESPAQVKAAFEPHLFSTVALVSALRDATRALQHVQG